MSRGIIQFALIANCLLACGGLTSSADDGGAWVCGNASAPPVLNVINGTTCDSQGTTACSAWAQSLVHQGTAHEQCAPFTGGSDVIPRCWAANVCAFGNFAVVCHCGNGPDCRDGGVCVSDSSNPTPHCVAACSE